MDILYCSALCSLKTIDHIEKNYNRFLSGLTAQKFYRLIVSGLIKNEANVQVVSSPPLIGTNKCVIKLKDDKEDSVKYHYPFIIDLPLFRHICIMVDSFLYSLMWLMMGKRERRVVICDCLNISMCLGTLMCRIFGVKVIGIVTDMPGLMIRTRRNVVERIASNTNQFILKYFDAYIFLTEAMNETINTKKRPYIIMEGLVDSNMEYAERVPDRNEKEIIYAGGIYEEYGVKMLIDAFKQIDNESLRLSIYGTGSMVKQMPEYEKQDSRLHYYGIRPNSEVVQAELKAFLLVNPRPTHEDFTKYSFPSKNMEYMVSGTPLLTTALPGMPEEYYDKVFICFDESVNGFYKKISEIINISDDELDDKGQKAKDFVLTQKNEVTQGKRIIEFIRVYVI